MAELTDSGIIGMNDLRVPSKDSGEDHVTIGLSFLWMALVFLKLHLKDRDLKVDQRTGPQGECVGDWHEWGVLHHIHCLIRSVYVRAAIDSSVLGSVIQLPLRTNPSGEFFDFHSVTHCRTMLICLGGQAIIAVLDDATACLQSCAPMLGRLTGPLSPLQVREVLARVSHLNLTLRDRPTFSSEVDTADGSVRLVCETPKRIHFHEDEDSLRKLFQFCCGPIFRGCEDGDEAMNDPRLGKYTYLFDDDQNFKYSPV